jgi:integrin alpha 2
MFNITLDADGYSSRITSRGLFEENNERYLQKNMVLTLAKSCSQYKIHIQVRPQSSLSLYFFSKTNEF